MIKTQKHSHRASACVVYSSEYIVSCKFLFQVLMLMIMLCCCAKDEQLPLWNLYRVTASPGSPVLPPCCSPA